MITQDGKAIVKVAIIGLVVTAIIGYSYFQSRNLLKGPQIVLTSPETGSTLTNPLVSVKGIASHISFISLNDRQIFVDKNGNFNEELLLSPGYNVWTIAAKDKFGRTVFKKIELVFRKS
jgi:hypothetical protein